MLINLHLLQVKHCVICMSFWHYVLQSRGHVNHSYRQLSGYQGPVHLIYQMEKELYDDSGINPLETDFDAHDSNTDQQTFQNKSLLQVEAIMLDHINSRYM